MPADSARCEGNRLLILIPKALTKPGPATDMSALESGSADPLGVEK